MYVGSTSFGEVDDGTDLVFIKDLPQLPLVLHREEDLLDTAVWEVVDVPAVTAIVSALLTRESDSGRDLLLDVRSGTVQLEAQLDQALRDLGHLRLVNVTAEQNSYGCPRRSARSTNNKSKGTHPYRYCVAT